MKKIFLFILFIITIITLSGCEQEPIVQKFYKTQLVQTGSVNTNSSYSSYAEWITESILSTKSGWRILSLLKNKWDRVLLWEKLAFLDADEAQVWYQASANVISSLNSLKSSVSSTYDAQILAMTQSLNKAEQALKWITTGKENTVNINASELVIYENKLQEAVLNYEFVKKNLEETKNVLDLQKEQIYKNAKNAITSSLILDTNIINFIDELLWVTPANRDKNDDFEDYLSAKNTTYLNESIELFKRTNTNYLEYKDFYETYVENKDTSNEKIIEWLKKWNALAWEFKELLRSTYDVLDNSIDNVLLSKEVINNYRQKIYELWNSVEASIITIAWEYPIWLKGSLDSMDLLERNTQKQLVLLNEQLGLSQKQIDIAKTNLEKIKNINTSNIDSINTNKEIWNISISEIKAQIESLKKEKSSKLNEINTQIEQAVWNRNMGSVQIWNSEIIAPFDWIITEKFLDEWQVIAWGTPVYKLVDDDTIKLKVYLNLSLIQNIKVSDLVSIEIEWVNHSFTWTISNVPNSQDQMSKNTEIEITINNEKHEIIVWSTAKVFIENSSDVGVIIPNKAIISDFMVPSVMTIKDNKASLKNIKILKQNDDFSLVEWLEQDEIIIIEGQENIWDGEELR